ncbi:diacylglycerol/lipid kinase family protein [Lolliginicoccus suaedae]|uniref:diacylglycerol/lipid kinase family protein n=1 Tax=Lolliginicoccus suaedae TaxID=2605429 RepID=UPI001F3193AD|nr:diacylglycerol kinase family protein [Lolliginicoccus suaedae]
MSTGRAFHFIVNREAGGGAAERTALSVARRIRSAGHEVRITPSAGTEHCRGLMPGSIARGKIIVAVGGDGTVGSLAGLVSTVGGTLGIVPAGRGNDLARQLGIPRAPAASAACLLHGPATSIDLIDVATASGAGLVVGSAYAGVESLASALVERAPRFLPAALQYHYAAVRALASFQPRQYVVDVDGATYRFRGFTTVIASSGFYGRGMHIAPDADPADGMLDIVMISAGSRARLMRALPRIYRGDHVALADVTILRGKQVEVRTEGPGEQLEAWGDGDRLGLLPLRAAVRPAALEVLVPRAVP